ncbi:unnamed protein product, partial [Iphiclides podalirius]
MAVLRGRRQLDGFEPRILRDWLGEVDETGGVGGCHFENCEESSQLSLLSVGIREDSRRGVMSEIHNGGNKHPPRLISGQDSYLATRECNGGAKAAKLFVRNKDRADNANPARPLSQDLLPCLRETIGRE